MSYNLLDEKWIPVQFCDGTNARLGLLEVLSKAGEIRQITASNPMDRVAILRFLLAVLYWCQGNPDKGETRIDFEAIHDKLEANRDCFNLLGEGKRFYQDQQANRSRPTTDLIQEIPTGNNFWHTRHATDGEEGLCIACCAIGLLRLPLFSVSGLPDLKSGINGTPPIYSIPIGTTLLLTLQLNTARCVESVGIPDWESDTRIPSTPNDPFLLYGLTLPSRRVWLHAQDGSGYCLNCGELSQSLVRSCNYQSSGNQENQNWNDPHVLYVIDKNNRKSLKTQDLTKSQKFKMDRPWQSILKQLTQSKTSELVSILLVGFATDKAKNVDIWERTIVLPSNNIGEDLIDQWDKSIWIMSQRLQRSKNLGGTTITSIRPHVEHTVSLKIDSLLSGGDKAWLHAAEAYRPMMQAVSKSLSPGFTTDAVERRRKIAETIPDMNPKPIVEKSSKKTNESTNE